VVHIHERILLIGYSWDSNRVYAQRIYAAKEERGEGHGKP